MRVVPIGTATTEHERTMRDLEELFSVPINPAFGPIVPLYTRNFPHMETKKRRGKDKKPRKKPEGSTPLQRAQRDRQSIIFPISGSVGNLRQALNRMNNTRHLFTPEEYEAGRKLYLALEDWFEAHNRVPDAWQKVKENLAASVDQAQEKV